MVIVVGVRGGLVGCDGVVDEFQGVEVVTVEVVGWG
jgi:hypothetical protein